MHVQYDMRKDESVTMKSIKAISFEGSIEKAGCVMKMAYYQRFYDTYLTKNEHDSRFLMYRTTSQISA